MILLQSLEFLLVKNGPEHDTRALFAPFNAENERNP
jgi:hypothetical protein